MTATTASLSRGGVPRSPWKKREALVRSIMAVDLLPGHGQDAEGDLLQGLGPDAAQAEGHGRTELFVAQTADQQFEAGRHHLSRSESGGPRRPADGPARFGRDLPHGRGSSARFLISSTTAPASVLCSTDRRLGLEGQGIAELVAGGQEPFFTARGNDLGTGHDDTQGAEDLLGLVLEQGGAFLRDRRFYDLFG